MITSLVLAAGESNRMGALKQILPFSDSTILETTVNNLIKTDLFDGEIRIILGAEAEKIYPHIKDIINEKIRVLVNADYQTGMLSSIKRGLKDLAPSTEHILITLADKPMIAPDTYNLIIEKYLADSKKIIVPVYDDVRGHPVIISKELVPQIKQLTNSPYGLRNLIKRHPEDVLYFPVDDKNIILDIDYFDEYKKYKNKVEDESINLNYKLWLEKSDKVFGDGPCDILLRIDRYGSLNKAAQDINMSYSQAWNLINDIEHRLGFKLIERHKGGSSGGGSKLTSKGRKFLNNFLAFRKEAHFEITRLENKYFGRDFWDEIY
ncbi:MULTISPECIES: NTP transferase domain-containing protein [unclassified Halanaerobium]|uniref:NTP transferase domain-containing protein n=1 Tax=unclassified Halanaerobium TaxID=2641197 RepID=UPI000DF39F4B|nr:MULTISPECIES: NTP transferase domain-containing protein [unclassified Halanaerobium]RCW47385.1 molybdate transport repressor ModE-like protein [Halanaerobium sp. MA284_MarDTE_T2]RCW84924.1 molybdate transport repressor ModE-like protein [Halanaerobium sp. DL-01]